LAEMGPKNLQMSDKELREVMHRMLNKPRVEQQQPKVDVLLPEEI